MPRKAIVIFSGYNQRAIIAFLRYATEQGVPFHIVASSPDDPILLTSYAKDVAQIREKKDFSVAVIIPILKDLMVVKSLDELVILPSSEYLNRVILANREAFLDHNILIPLVEEDIYQKVSDKYTFRGLCSERGIRVPEIYSQTDGIQPPFVIKPRKYFSPDGVVQFKPQLIYTVEQFEHLQGENSPTDFYVEEYVEGRSLYLLYYISKTEASVCYSQENLVQQPEGGSMIASHSSDLHQSKLAEQYMDLFKQVGFYGLVMVEVRESSKGIYMIEANPRLWGPSQLFVDANVPIFRNFLVDLGFEIKGECLEASMVPVHYFWSDGLSELGLDDQNLAFHSIGAEEFKDQVATFLESDVYARDDTISIHNRKN